MASKRLYRQSILRHLTLTAGLLLPSLTQAASSSSKSSSKVTATFDQKAIAPSCTTDASGSTSCNVGINSVSVTSYASLDGGYQWLTDEITTTTASGTKTTETGYSFTAKETNFLSSMVITTTVSGKPTTTTSTEYVSFVTATPMVDGKTEAAVVAAVVIAPALVASVQKVADSASGKTVDQLVSDLSTAFNGQKITLSQGELTTLATYVLNLVALAATAEVGAVVIGPYLRGASAPLSPSPNTAVTTTTSSSGSTVTAIVKTPYDNWASIFSAVGTSAPGPLPSDSTSTSATSTSATPSSTPRPEYA